MTLQKENMHQKQQNYDNKLTCINFFFKSQVIFFPETRTSTICFHFGNVCIVGIFFFSPNFKHPLKITHFFLKIRIGSKMIEEKYACLTISF